MNKKEKHKPFALSTLVQLKALADPIRYQVFEQLIEIPKTAKQVSGLMGVKPTRLYHHFKVLEKAGLIHKTKTSKKRGAIEKYYKTVADRITIDPELLEKKSSGATSIYSGLFQATIKELAGSLKRRKTRPMVVKRVKMNLTLTQARALETRIMKLINACDTSSEGKTRDKYAITVAFYPRPD